MCVCVCVCENNRKGDGYCCSNFNGMSEEEPEKVIMSMSVSDKMWLDQKKKLLRLRCPLFLFSFFFFVRLELKPFWRWAPPAFSKEHNKSFGHTASQRMNPWIIVLKSRFNLIPLCVCGTGLLCSTMFFLGFFFCLRISAFNSVMYWD